MENLEIYEKSRACPENALRPILGGKLKGKSDINPIWRIKQLTELFGPCGIGWKPTNVKYWTEPGANGEVSAWCSLELKIKVDGQWSDGIEGVGGSMLVETEKGKLVTNDEAYKMAQTDAISVCCKMLGFAADVYWNADRTKYSRDPEGPAPQQAPPPAPRQAPPPAPQQAPPPQQQSGPIRCERCDKMLMPTKMKDGGTAPPAAIAKYSMDRFGHVFCPDCQQKAWDEQVRAINEQAARAANGS